MRSFIRKIHETHKTIWNRETLISFFISCGFLIVALFIQSVAGAYVRGVRVVAVDDLLLSSLPVVDVDIFIVQGALLLAAISLALGLFKPKYLIFALKASSLFIIVRAFLISLTHLGPNLGGTPLDTHLFGFSFYNALFNANARNDFFFSGHTGIPFLFALIIWRERFWRYFFLGASLFFGTIVLLGHAHYSIDVFAAPMITYSIFAIARVFFPKDYALTRR